MALPFGSDVGLETAQVTFVICTSPIETIT